MFGFEHALRLVKNRYQVRRKAWEPKQYLTMHPTHHLALRLPDGHLVPYLALNTDLLGEDWEEYETIHGSDAR